MAKDTVLIGTKNNGVTKVGVGKYFFCFKKRKKNEKDFRETSTFETTEGLQKVRSAYKNRLKEKEAEYEIHLKNPNRMTKAEKLKFRDITENPDTYW